MRVERTRAGLRAALAAARRPVGLVPTMGALHAGHRSLIARARAENATVLLSIFVNPRQFNEESDFARYPRDEEQDLAICEADGVDIVFAPPVEEVYPPGFDTRVVVGQVAQPLEGAARPGHFEGVTTVVAVLFGLAGAERAYFGQKDAQQTVVVRRMTADLAIPTDIVVCPTVREPDGLALSSRNALLSPLERSAAGVLFRALRGAAARYEAGERNGNVLRATMRAILAEEPLARPEYVSVADAATLTELDRVEGPAILSLAVRIGSTRLIDNIPLG
jgi:pantoate--beta-alanine ligase